MPGHADYRDDFVDLVFGVRALHFAAFLSAMDNAMATACLWGRPARVSVRMFSEMARREHPLINGIL